jgi:hypothetical protein
VPPVRLLRDCPDLVTEPFKTTPKWIVLLSTLPEQLKRTMSIDP